MDPDTLLYPGEARHLRNVRQLTFEGENAEAYFAPDGETLVFQARRGDGDCDRIFALDAAGGAPRPISSGEGRTTCAYFTYPDGDAILYASTHLAGAACPPEPDQSRGYVWPLYASYDLFLRREGEPLERLTRTPGYDAEATACFVDGRVVFTSVRDGDLDLDVMDPLEPERAPTRLTREPGYDGGAFFSPDCNRLVWRASRPEGADLDAYRELLAQGLVRPSRMQIFVAHADGTNAKQITHNAAANFAPYFLPDNRRVLFSSNPTPKPRSSASPSARSSTPSPCSAPTAASWCSRPTATRASRATPTCSSPSGWTEPPAPRAPRRLSPNGWSGDGYASPRAGPACSGPLSAR
jgi:Tol biopolymer transport system component